jgi:kumamolisin
MYRGVLCFAMVAAASLASAQVRRPVVIPQSSIERPEDVGVRMHSNYFMYAPDPSITPDTVTPGLTTETPGSIACIYGLVTHTAGCPVSSATTVPTGGSETIVIVDAYDDPHPYLDLQAFDARFGLPNPPFAKLFANGRPPNGCANGWEGEEALDIEWAHAMAPKARIVLMEALSNSATDLFDAVQKAEAYIAAHGGKGEISMSWGGSEFLGENSLDSVFQATPGIVYFAASGDGPGPIYPSASPWVVSVGATQINRNSSGNYTGQVATKNCDPLSDGCGSGKSAFEGRPSYQDVVSGVVGSARGTPDIASDSSSSSPVWVNDSSCYGGWIQVYGTSVAAPTVAGIVNRAGGFKNLSSAELTEVYNNFTNTADYTDIKTGGCGGRVAAAGYDKCTGVGVVKGYGKK